MHSSPVTATARSLRVWCVWSAVVRRTYLNSQLCFDSILWGKCIILRKSLTFIILLLKDGILWSLKKRTQDFAKNDFNFRDLFYISFNGKKNIVIEFKVVQTQNTKYELGCLWYTKLMLIDKMAGRGAPPHAHLQPILT